MPTSHSSVLQVPASTTSSPAGSSIGEEFYKEMLYLSPECCSICPGYAFLRTSSPKRLIRQIERRIIQIGNREVEDIHDVLVLAQERQVSKEAEIVVEFERLRDERGVARTCDGGRLCVLQRNSARCRACIQATHRILLLAASIIWNALRLSLARCLGVRE